MSDGRALPTRPSGVTPRSVRSPAFTTFVPRSVHRITHRALSARLRSSPDAPNRGVLLRSMFVRNRRRTPCLRTRLNDRPPPGARPAARWNGDRRTRDRRGGDHDGSARMWHRRPGRAAARAGRVRRRLDSGHRRTGRDTPRDRSRPPRPRRVGGGCRPRRPGRPGLARRRDRGDLCGGTGDRRSGARRGDRDALRHRARRPSRSAHPRRHARPGPVRTRPAVRRGAPALPRRPRRSARTRG